MKSALTDKMIDGDEDHNESGQVEAEHLVELEYLAAHVSQHPFHRVEPEIIIPTIRFYSFPSRTHVSRCRPNVQFHP